MKDKKEMFLTYLKSNVAPVLVDFLSINELDFAVTIPADIDIKELNGHYVELLKYRKISTFELPKDCLIIITANEINTEKISNEIFSLVACI